MTRVACLAAVGTALALLGGCSNAASEAKIQAAIERCAKVPGFSREIQGNAKPDERQAIERAIADSEAATKAALREICEKGVRASCAKNPTPVAES
ncbi:MAG: hypothetical protein ING59_00255 [Burkholderiales bacterium]|jgi:hypothetical protein|nr:hypothetical protein [Burkholderiales bacterium]